MFRRNFRRFSSARFPRGRRRGFGPRLRIPKEPFRWEVGQFHFRIQNVVNEVAPLGTTVVSLAQIADHFGDLATAQGTALNDAMRFLEIGGIVFGYRIRRNWERSAAAPNPGVTQQEQTDSVDYKLLVVSDRLNDDGQPSTIPNWFNTTPPIINVASTTATDRDTRYPLRIHWQAYHGSENSTALGDPANAIGPSSYFLDSRSGRANLRLRLRLQDDVGLFFHFAQVVNDPSTAEFENDALVTISGTLYYRWRL